MAHRCLRYRCLPGWHGRQRLWGLVLRHGWVLRTGSSTQAFRDTSASPSHYTQRGRAPGLSGSGSGWAHTWLPHACEPPRRTPASSPSSV